MNWRYEFLRWGISLKVLHGGGRDSNRMKVRIRDNFTCQDCGARRTPRDAKMEGKRLFDTHHTNGVCGKKSRGYDKVSEMGGLITLCHQCHFARHDFEGKLGGGKINERELQIAKDMRKDGATYGVIASELWVSYTGAWKALNLT